jgi:hypothetical protein
VKKVDRIRELLEVGRSPKEVAREVGCALSLVYAVRGRQGMAWMNHQIAVIQQELFEIHERIAALEGKPRDVIDRMLDRE